MRGEIITDCLARTHCDSHSELFAEIKPTHFRIFCQVARRAGTKNLPFSHDVSTVSDPQSLSHVVIRDEDADAPTAKIENYALNVVDGFGIDAGKGFIQKNELRFSCESSRNLSSASFASGQ